MKSSTFLTVLSLAIAAQGATIPASPWTTLTATATIPSSVSALTDFTGSFALSVLELAPASSTTAPAKRAALTQISDGQIQDQTTLAQATASVLAQITDGQVQQQTTASVLAQITDGQVQQQTTASVLAQITDGQVQQQTTASVLAQITDGQVQQQTTASVLAQITDGQVQQQTTASVLAQITDGQVQQQTTTATKPTTAAAVSQISDGQIQQPTTAAGQASQISDGQVQATTLTQASQITDGQVQATGSSSPAAGTSGSASGFVQTCAASNSLVLNLNGGILTDSHGRIGAIVANRQFQFDGPPPQAGTIYAKGWSIVPNSYTDPATQTKSGGAQWGKLALGTQTTFFKCLSGDFYNLYDQSIGGQCSEVEFQVLEIVSC